jgi:Sigma-70, region 4
MRKIKEILRLRFELGLGQREIARACSISQGAVHTYLKKVAGAGIQWPLSEEWDEKQIEEAVFGKHRSIEDGSMNREPSWRMFGTALCATTPRESFWQSGSSASPFGIAKGRMCSCDTSESNMFGRT